MRVWHCDVTICYRATRVEDADIAESEGVVTDHRVEGCIAAIDRCSRGA